MHAVEKPVMNRAVANLRAFAVAVAATQPECFAVGS